MTKYITQEKLENLKKELKQLETVDRLELASELKEAISHGDLSENAAYDAAKERQAMLEGKIAELQDAIKNSIVAEKNESGEIQIGSKITIESKGEQDTYEIVGAGESDPINGKLSYEAPLIQPMMGHSAGDEIEISFDGEKIKYKIVSVE